MKTLKLLWKYRVALPELMALVTEAAGSVADRQVDQAERYRLNARFWALIDKIVGTV